MKPASLYILEVLRKRKRLSNADQNELSKQRKGYEGEQRFAAFVNKYLPLEVLVIYSILLKTANNHFQIDCIILMRGEIYLIDTKNYQGDFMYHEDDFRLLKSEKRIKNPLHQLSRCEYLLRDFLQQFKIHHKISPFIVFIHPEFTLYKSPLNFTIIYLSQVRRFLEKIKYSTGRAETEEKMLAQLLLDNHIVDNPFNYVPGYHYGELQKGLFCLQCSKALKLHNRAKFICKHCGDLESVESGVLRGIIEFSILFPERKIKTSTLHDFFGEVITVRRIRIILQRYLMAKGNTRSTNFEFY